MDLETVNELNRILYKECNVNFHKDRSSDIILYILNSVKKQAQDRRTNICIAVVCDECGFAWKSLPCLRCNPVERCMMCESTYILKLEKTTKFMNGMYEEKHYQRQHYQCASCGFSWYLYVPLSRFLRWFIPLITIVLLQMNHLTNDKPSAHLCLGNLDSRSLVSNLRTTLGSSLVTNWYIVKALLTTILLSVSLKSSPY